jgi:hypothetical protein
MTLSAELSSLIETRIEEYLRRPADPMQVFARGHRALPVYADIDRLLFLRPDGEILSKDNANTSGDLVAEQSAYWCLMARLAAAERFPDLAALIPARPSSASDCADCEGRGKVLNDMVRCEVCHGLGWVDSSANAAK